MHRAAHETVTSTITEGIAHVVIDRPATLNSLTREVFEDLVEVGLSLRETPAVRAVVVSGAGRAFSAGLDVSEFARLAEAGERDPDADDAGRDLADPDLAEAGERSDGSAVVLGERLGAARALAQKAVHIWSLVEVPVIAAVSGPALGGGMQIALGADLRIAHPESRFAMMETRWGIIPDMCGTQLLPRLVGAGMAKRLILTGETIDGSQAHRIGLVEELSEQPVERALALAAELASRSRSALVRAKALVDGSFESSLVEGFDAEQEALSELLGTAEQKQAAEAQLAALRTTVRRAGQE